MKRITCLLLIILSWSCTKEDLLEMENQPPIEVDLDDLAQVFSALPMGVEQVQEVYDAVLSSSENGYDEEYRMVDLLEEPGRGVGVQQIRRLKMKTGDGSFLKRNESSYSVPLKSLLEEYLKENQTKSSSSSLSPEEFLSLLKKSQMQIYWPYSERWDGKTMPIITFDPENGSESNWGYQLIEDERGSRVEEILVTEELAATRPVWVMNRNDDSEFTTIEVHRQSDPDWGTGGGSVVIDPKDISDPLLPELKTLLIKDFTALRQFDSWFAGASEYFIKSGSIEEFTASTEAELQLFNPIITDFMVVVRRNEVGIRKTLNTVLVSDMSPQLVNSAFMMIEDDGGKQTKWECEAIVKIKSRSYGFMVSIPYNSHDDIVWRGSLSTKYFWNRNNVTENFGDVQLTFQIVRIASR